MIDAQKHRICLNKLGFQAHRCIVCGVEFEARKEYAYKIAQGKCFQWFCSWHCIQAYRAEIDNKPKTERRKQSRPVSVIEPLVMDLISEGVKGVEIAERLEISNAWVSRIRKKMKDNKTRECNETLPEIAVHNGA